MLSIIAMTITGSFAALFWLLVTAAQAAALTDAFLAYLIGGLVGFALAVLLSPATARLQTDS